MISNPQQQLDFSQAASYECEACGYDKFIMSYIIKKFSPLVSPTGKEMVVPIQAFSCGKCGHINDDFLPEHKGLD